MKSEWIELAVPMELRESMQAIGSSELRAFARGPVRCLVSRDGPDRLWHISISCERRYPSWNEQVKARYDLLPDDITVASYLPPRAEYVNVHPNCFHWMEVRESRIIIP
jgi:hypothetical protein